MEITVTAIITGTHAKTGMYVETGQSYTIDEADFSADVFETATPMGIEPTPTEYLQMQANPSVSYTPLYPGDHIYPGDGIHVGGARCNDTPAPEEAYPFHVGNIFYPGQGIYPGGGL